MRVLLFGAGGMLAADMIASAPRAAHLVPLDRAALDVTDTSALRKAVAAGRPDWIINCSGATDVEEAERNPGAAMAVNADAVDQMGRVAREQGCAVLHFSTDYVFDGSLAGFYAESDTPAPLNAYGASKLAGEEALRASGARHLIIRTQWLFGSRGRSFVGLMADRARSRLATRVVNDQTGCFTYTRDLARATWALLPVERGTLHVVNRGQVTRFTAAQRIFAALGVPGLVSPCASREFVTLARRPANSALSVARAETLLGRRMPTWEDALDRFMAEHAA